MSKESLEEYVLLCGERIMLPKGEHHYFKNDSTACIEKCSNKEISGNKKKCPFFADRFEYTFVCGKKARLQRRFWVELREFDKRTSVNLMACNFCPAGVAQEKCPDYQKGLKEEDAKYREWSKQSEKEGEKPKRKRGRPKKIITVQKRRGRP